MSKVAKYRRQVSEDPDIDNLLSTLSPEEMEELEKELDVVDADGSIPADRGQTNQSENSSPGPQNCDTAFNHHDRDTRRVLQREQSIDVSHIPPLLRERWEHTANTPWPPPAPTSPRAERGTRGKTQNPRKASAC